MSQTFKTKRRVEFRDTDAAGIVHFSVFFGYMEQAEHEFLRSLGLSVIQHFGPQCISWPRVRAECDYRRPARFEEELDISLTVARIGEKSVTYQFVFGLDGETIANGQIVAACCEVKNHQLAASVQVPDEFAKRIRPFVAVTPPHA